MAETVVLDPVERAAGTNLCTNPRAFSATTDWTNTSLTTFERVADAPGDVPDEVGGETAFHGIGDATSDRARFEISVTSGLTYVFSAWVYLVSGTVDIAMFNTSDTLLESGADLSTTGVWTRISLTTTPGSSGTRRIAVRQVAAGASEFYWTGFLAEQSSSVGSYFDGDKIASTPTVTYAWTGTAHASTSTATVHRTELDITPWLDQQGIDWGDAEIEAFMAEQQLGSVPIDFRTPNRAVSAPLVFAETLGGTAPSTARANIQAKLALIQREGGWLKRITNAGGTVYADVVNSAFRATSVPGWASRASADLDSSFTLECLPEFYEAETHDSDNSTTTARELIFNTALSGAGDNPNRVRLIVDNDGSTDFRGLIWAFRSRHFHSESTASSEYEAEELQALDTATKPALTGASGGTVVTHGTLSTNWTPVVGTNIAGTGYLTHTGTNRIFARIYSTSGTTVQSRFVYDVGDLVNPEELDSFRLPGASNFYIKDYGEVRLDQAPVGTHRWQGQIQAKGDAGGENFSVDKVWVANVDEGYGKDTAPINITEGLSTYSARSEFTTESGAITGDSLAVGGTWTGVGDADDLSVSGGVATRTAVSDSSFSPHAGRMVTASTPTLTDCVTTIDFKRSVDVNAGHMLIARYTDINNYLAMTLTTNAINIWKRVGGAVVQQIADIPTPLEIAVDVFYTLLLYVGANGIVRMYVNVQGAASTLRLTLYDSDLTAAGSLSSGKVGFGDLHVLSTAITRTYDNFAAWVPSSDAVIFDGRSAQLTTDGLFRQDSSGSAYGPISNPIGDLPRFPVPSQAGGTVETLLIPTEGDFDQLPDGTAATRSISARASRRPSWLFVDDS